MSADVRRLRAAAVKFHSEPRRQFAANRTAPLLIGECNLRPHRLPAEQSQSMSAVVSEEMSKNTRGTIRSAAGVVLELGQLAMTRAMCPPESLHDRIAKQWPYIRSYVMKDGHPVSVVDGRRRHL